MIRAVIFDLDGTLVKTERLKAISYARAAQTLCPEALPENAVINAFKDVVGLPRKEVAVALMERFNLEMKAREYMAAFGVGTPWQAFVQLRLTEYDRLLADPETIRNNQWPHTVSLLREAHRMGCRVALATMSHCEQVRRVLEILALAGEFDFVATRDDVEHGKPDPEIYLLVAGELGVERQECLVIEDSPAGVQAALTAGMQVLAVSTPFTREHLHSAGLLPDSRIIDDPNTLSDAAGEILRRDRS